MRPNKYDLDTELYHQQQIGKAEVKRMKRRDRYDDSGVPRMFAIMAFLCGWLSLAMIAGIIFVIVHFISKYW